MVYIENKGNLYFYRVWCAWVTAFTFLTSKSCLAFTHETISIRYAHTHIHTLKNRTKQIISNNNKSIFVLKTYRIWCAWIACFTFWTSKSWFTHAHYTSISHLVTLTSVLALKLTVYLIKNETTQNA